MTKAEKQALYHYIKKLRLADVEIITKDEKSAYLVKQALAKIKRFIGDEMVKKRVKI